MKKVGKKQKAWLRARHKIIKRAIAEGRIEVNQKGHIRGYCEDCGKYRHLTPDHKRKRSLGGKDIYENIDWVCVKCHDLRDKYGDPMGKKKKNKKAKWEQRHKCKKCRAETELLICHNCGKMSI